jgi:hypothetical protein
LTRVAANSASAIGKSACTILRCNNTLPGHIDELSLVIASTPTALSSPLASTHRLCPLPRGAAGRRIVSRGLIQVPRAGWDPPRVPSQNPDRAAPPAWRRSCIVIVVLASSKVASNSDILPLLHTSHVHRQAPPPPNMAPAPGPATDV